MLGKFGDIAQILRSKALASVVPARIASVQEELDGKRLYAQGT